MLYFEGIDFFVSVMIESNTDLSSMNQLWNYCVCILW